jgi:homoprotocatechuate degradation regulator HpaR
MKRIGTRVPHSNSRLSSLGQLRGTQYSCDAKYFRSHVNGCVVNHRKITENEDMTVEKPPLQRTRETSRALPIALLRARETVMSPIRDMLHDLNLTEQKWRILRTLEECGQVEQSTISKEACLLLPSLTRILRAMEADGQISRSADATDKRRTLVEITDVGRAILRDNIHVSNGIYQSIQSQMGQEKLDTLLDLLQELQQVRV